MNECVEGIIDGCMNGWINRKIHVLDENIDKQIDGWMDRQIDAWWMDGLMGGWMDGKMHRQIFEQMKGNLDGCMNQWMNREVHVLDESMDEWMD